MSRQGRSALVTCGQKPRLTVNSPFMRTDDTRVNKSLKPHDFKDRPPYKDAFDIDYPQEEVPGQTHVHRCKYCKVLTTQINGRLENHEPTCEYRVRKTGS